MSIPRSLPSFEVLCGLLALLCAGSMACAEAAEAVESDESFEAQHAADERPRAPADSQVDEQLESLRALGYTTWGDDVAEERAGVVLHDARAAHPGVNLYADMESTVFALDMQGEPLHRWTIPGRSACIWALSLGGGRLAVVSVDEGVSVVDRDSRVLWSSDFNAHHDLCARPEGGFLVPYWEDHDYLGRRVRFDGIAWLSEEGEIERRWSTFEQLEELRRLHPERPLDHPPAAELSPEEAEKVYDYYHLNSVAILPATPIADADERFRAGNLVVCLRNASVVLVLDRDTLEPTWSWGPGELDWPHMPTMTPEGNVLIFDNGMHRGHSRVVELDPREDRIVWSWQTDPPEDFYSRLRGSAQRLPNGNTLVCDSNAGRAFELTRAGEIVWDFWNPDVREGHRRQIYRFVRADLEEREALLGD